MNRKFEPNAKLGAQDSDYPFPLAALANGSKVRVSKRVAKEWLMHQQTIVYQGTVHHLQMKDIGLGIYEVMRLPSNWHHSSVVRDFINP